MDVFHACTLIVTTSVKPNEPSCNFMERLTPSWKGNILWLFKCENTGKHSCMTFEKVNQKCHHAYRRNVHLCFGEQSGKPADIVMYFQLSWCFFYLARGKFSSGFCVSLFLTYCVILIPSEFWEATQNQAKRPHTDEFLIFSILV